MLHSDLFSFKNTWAEANILSITNPKKYPAIPQDKHPISIQRPMGEVTFISKCIIAHSQRAFLLARRKHDNENTKPHKKYVYIIASIT
jgi:hypothetical protein